MQVGESTRASNLVDFFDNDDRTEETIGTSQRRFFKEFGATAAAATATSNISDYSEHHRIARNFELDDRNFHLRLNYLYGTLPLILFCIISVGINIKILMSVNWIRRPLSPTLHISLSLAGADAFSSTALAIGLIVNSLIPHGLGFQFSEGAGCPLLGLEAVRLGGVMITVGHLVALAVNHYLGILRPLHYLSTMTHGTTSCLIVLIWSWPLAFFFTYFSLVDNEGFQSQNCETNLFLFQKKFRLMFSSLFFGPFILMVCIYAHIFHIVRKHQASRLRFSRAGSPLEHGGGYENSAERRTEESATHQMARNIKAIKTTLFILGSFVIGWMPAIFLYILVCEDCPLKFDWISDNAKFLVYNASNCLIILKSLVNPIIYAARMHEIQVATRRMHAYFFRLRDRTNYSKESNRTRSSDGQATHRALSVSKSAHTRFPLNSPNNKRKGRREESELEASERYIYTNTRIKPTDPRNTDTFV